MKTNALFAVAAVVLISGCASSPVALTPQPKQVQSDSCVGYPAAPGATGSIDDVSSEPSDHGAVCRARAALAAGQYVVSYSSDVLLGEVDGDTTESDDFEDGSLPPVPIGATTPEPVPTGAAADTQEPIHAYGLYVDPETSVPFTLSAGAYTIAEARSEVASWVTATVTSQKKRIATSSTRFSQASVNAPSYNVSAWTLVASGTIDHAYSSTVYTLAPNMTNDFGDAGAIVNVYRLNTRSPSVDDFLVDTYYTQTPRWHQRQYYFPSEYYYWWNSATKLTLNASDPWHPNIRPILVDFAPTTPITTADITNTVGKGLSKYANYTEYSRTESQPSVTTDVNGSLGQSTVAWSDKYVDVIGPGVAFNPNPPGTTTNTFAGDRLTVFEVPRTVNDNVPVGKVPGLNIDVELYSEVHGFVGLLGLGQVFRGDFKSSTRVFAPEPLFAVSLTSINVSISQNSATNPAIVNVTAERPDVAQKITWHAVTVPAFLTTNVDANGITGSGQLKIVPNNARINDTGFITLSSQPAGGSDSLRTGSYQIGVKIVP